MTPGPPVGGGDDVVEAVRIVGIATAMNDRALSARLLSGTGTPAYAVVRDTIRSEIMRGRLLPGARLTTASLVERFGISQMPVREALQALEGEGLVTILPHRGATVLSLDEKRVVDIYRVRGSIEGLLACLSLPNLTNAAMSEIAAVHRELKEVLARGEQKAIFPLNARFHNLIYRHADNPEALGIYDRYAGILGALRDRYGFSALRMRQIADEHEEILQALRTQDEARLEAVVRLHMEGAKADLVARMRQDAAPPLHAEESGAGRILA